MKIATKEELKYFYDLWYEVVSQLWEIEDFWYDLMMEKENFFFENIFESNYTEDLSEVIIKIFEFFEIPQNGNYYLPECFDQDFEYFSSFEYFLKDNISPYEYYIFYNNIVEDLHNIVLKGKYYDSFLEKYIYEPLEKFARNIEKMYNLPYIIDLEEDLDTMEENFN